MLTPLVSRLTRCYMYKSSVSTVGQVKYIFRSWFLFSIRILAALSTKQANFFYLFVVTEPMMLHNARVS